MKKICLFLFCIVFVISACNASPTYPPVQQATEPPTEVNSMLPEISNGLPEDSPTESEPETQLNPEPVSVDEATTATNETAIIGRIDIQHLFGDGETVILFNDVRHVFGTFLGYGDIFGTVPHIFEGGITAHALNVPNMDESSLEGIVIDYRRASDTIIFHFDNIVGTSTYNDVIARFGNPSSGTIRTGFDEERLGAVKSYGYRGGTEGRFVRFFFDEGNNVVAISYFVLN